MPKHRTPLPAEIKELIRLIREGHLFEVQQWIKDGKRSRLPSDGYFITSPLIVAVQSGFYSMVELLLSHLADEEDLDCLVRRAIGLRRLDLIQLLCKFGADPKAVSLDEAASSGNPLILRWFEDQGIDLETGNPVAEAFRWKNRGVLGTYMRWRKELPGLKYQADLALRFHAKYGNIGWVCLLLWAGADPRAEVPKMENTPPEAFMGTAVEEAFSRGHVEIVKKFKIDPRRDNVHRLLAETWLTANRELVDMLLALGADPADGGDRSATQMYVWTLGNALDSSYPFRRSPDGLVDILCLFASRGGRWRPGTSHRYSSFRRSLSRAPEYEVIEILSRLAKAGLFEPHVFKTLMATPKMRKLLECSAPGVIALRQLAGVREKKKVLVRGAKSPSVKPH